MDSDEEDLKNTADAIRERKKLIIQAHRLEHNRNRAILPKKSALKNANLKAMSDKLSKHGLDPNAAVQSTRALGKKRSRSETEADEAVKEADADIRDEVMAREMSNLGFRNVKVKVGIMNQWKHHCLTSCFTLFSKNEKPTSKRSLFKHNPTSLANVANPTELSTQRCQSICSVARLPWVLGTVDKQPKRSFTLKKIIHIIHILSSSPLFLFLFPFFMSLCIYQQLKQQKRMYLYSRITYDAHVGFVEEK